MAHLTADLAHHVGGLVYVAYAGQCFSRVHDHKYKTHWEAEPMTTTGDGRTLPWRFLGRQVRPYALAVSLACAVI